MPNTSHIFPDHFSGNSAQYARFRPKYPKELYETLASLAQGHTTCWDCATGSGQAAVALASSFERVVATDASAQQLDQAEPHPRVEYRHEPAEATSIDSDSVDLVTVAAALHWLDLDRFYPEVHRVTRGGAVVAAWTYDTDLRVSPEVDDVIRRFTEEILGPHWAPEYAFVTSGYQTLAFPFEPLQMPDMAVTVQWTRQQLVGLLGTWSASNIFLAEHGHMATDLVASELARAWGPEHLLRPVRMPLRFRVGRVV